MNKLKLMILLIVWMVNNMKKYILINKISKIALYVNYGLFLIMVYNHSNTIINCIMLHIILKLIIKLNDNVSCETWENN